MGFNAGLRFFMVMIIFALIVNTIMAIYIDGMGKDLQTSTAPKPGDHFTSAGPMQLLSTLGTLLTSIFVLAGFIGFLVQLTKPDSTYTGQTYTESYMRRY